MNKFTIYEENPPQTYSYKIMNDIKETSVVWEKAVDTFQDGSYSKYSSCDHTIRRGWKYCPYCGAKVKVIGDLNE
nr:MAG TPA: PROTEIN/RNA Complex, archaeal, ribosomal, 50S, protein.0A [Caudoviricetes sp.]